MVGNGVNVGVMVGVGVGEFVAVGVLVAVGVGVSVGTMHAGASNRRLDRVPPPQFAVEAYKISLFGPTHTTCTVPSGPASMPRCWKAFTEALPNDAGVAHWVPSQCVT